MTKSPPRLPGRKPVSAKDVADELGISISTVSRAFSPDANVAPETRERILAHAKSIGYRPNPFARTLITQRTSIVTIFISDIHNPFFPEVLVSLTDELQNAGLTVMLFHVPVGKTPDEVLPEALRYQPEYVIVMTATVSFQREMAVTDSGTRLIFFNRYVPGTNTFSVTCDNKRGGREIAEFLLGTGHRRMAYIAGTPGATTSIDRGRGFMQRCTAAGLSVIQDNEARLFSYEDGRAAAKRLMTQHPGIDAIFCANDLVAIGAKDGLRYDMGLDVPGDVSVVGFDDVAMAGWQAHALTTYLHPIKRMATATVDLIKEIDADPAKMPVAIRVPGELVPRATHLDRTGLPLAERQPTAVKPGTDAA